MMRITRPVFAVAALVVAMAGGAAAQQTTPVKPGPAPQKPDASTGDDQFLPPLRGTPDGRISGGTRGLVRPPGSATTATDKPQ
jgi:hypothetical protein